MEGHFSGIGHYILGMLRGFDELVEKSKLENKPFPKITVVIPYDMVPKYLSYGLKHLEYKTVPFSFRLMSILWHRGLMAPLDIFCGKGIYVFTRFVGMPLVFSKSATIEYDLSYKLFKEYTEERNARFLSKGVAKTVAKSERVITISNNSKRELIEHYNCQASDIVVAYPAVDQRYFYRRSPKEVAAVKKKYGIKGDYILALSNLEPRKNLDGLIDAYCNLPKSVTDKVGLLLVGVDAWKTDKLFAKIMGKVKAGFNIMRPSEYVSDEDRPAIISGAKMLVYPSHYEGFGMPPLEALACGVPVITSDNSSLPEAIGNAGTMVNAHDTEGLTKEIERCLAESEKLTRLVIKAGAEQASKFSWSSSALKIVKALEEIN